MTETRFRRRLRGFALALLCASPSFAQSPDPSPSPSPAPRFNPDAESALPTAGSLTARVVQLNAGLVLEREEGVGLFPAEPSRFSFRGGSWTQSRIEIDGFDVTDPVFGGRALVWGAVELGEAGVRTDANGTVLTHDHPGSTSPGRTRFLAQGNLGLFDSKGTTADPIPSLARGHHLFDGVFAASSASSTGATNWSGALSGADVSRSERDTDRERATQRLGFEGRVNHVRGDDRFQALGLYQGHREPFGFTTAETRSTGLFLGGGWTRTAASPNRTSSFLRASFLRGTVDDPTFASSVPFERLVDGTPAQQAPYDSTAGKAVIEGGRSVWSAGPAFQVNAIARFSRATSARSLSQSTFVGLESLNGTPAREWTFTGGSAARLAENRTSLRVLFNAETSARTRLSGAVEALHVNVGDRDGESILSATKLLPELRFEWMKSGTTSLFAQASIGAAPTPLAGYELATRNAPVVVARRWRDLNRDGAATPSELGLVVATRNPGSMTVDPDLTLPTLRQVMVGFKARVLGVGIRAVLYARRDRDLIETALDPQGSDIGSTRSIPDPSGDILGSSDDQLLPIVEENARSFTQSRYVLTNPPDHRALGEGAELGFEANSKHVHWGLNGAAFRDSGRGGNRSFRVDENDFGVVGESFNTTNADTYGYGRLFFDRAYSLKMYLTANGLHGFTFGAVGRYDDGQPFARLVIQNDLPQGPDFVQAIERGRARLHYTLSVDARIAKRFKAGENGIEVSASVFNALGSRFEAEEQMVWQADYRRITMVQPPRAFLVSLRIER
jgi:hypothetical protein